MSKKSNLKQHLLMVILFLTGNFIFTIYFFSGGTKEKISNLKRQIGESQKQENFLRSKSPKVTTSVSDLKKQIEDLNTQNQKYYETLFGGSKRNLSPHEKVNIITENASKLNIAVESSSTTTLKDKTVYQLQFTSPFHQIVNLIKMSNKELGKVNIRSISMKNEEGTVSTTVEFIL
ncbi:MAG: hypothetical protein NE327_06095 [Lentisphaeraceae bacterium]|nr:hypothetical protein [Lentisphaeraceae bacterium]